MQATDSQPSRSGGKEGRLWVKVRPAKAMRHARASLLLAGLLALFFAMTPTQPGASFTEEPLALPLESASPAPLPVRKKAEIFRAVLEINPSLSCREADQIASSVIRTSREVELPLDILLAVMLTESTFRTHAVSYRGAVGLMQVLPSTAADVARGLDLEWSGTDLYNPEKNITIGSHYLRQLVDRFDAMEVALAAYNMGPTRVHGYLSAERPLPRTYANQVYKNLQHFAGI